MHFVSQLVFSAGVTPDIEIIQWLTKCVAFSKGTKKFSLFTTEDVVDASPVLRSFLIKLFLQSPDSIAVKDYINSEIEKGKNDNQQELLSRMVLVMNCHKVIGLALVALDSIG